MLLVPKTSADLRTERQPYHPQLGQAAMLIRTKAVIMVHASISNLEALGTVDFSGIFCGSFKAMVGNIPPIQLHVSLTALHGETGPWKPPVFYGFMGGGKAWVMHC